MSTRWLISLMIPALIALRACSEPECGCTDPLASNYDPDAEVNDGSCTYEPATAMPGLSLELDAALNETSGLRCRSGVLYTHNDSGEPILYALNPEDGSIHTTVTLEGVSVTDWEDLGQDENYFYIGDVGNNASGDRDDLHLLRVASGSLSTGPQEIDTLLFSYERQDSLEPAAPNQTDFDCEALIVAGDSIFLFTKQWTSGGTEVYAIPNTPGHHVARWKGSFQAEGLITGACWVPEKQLVVLCGYSPALIPFVYLLYDYKGRDFFSGNRRRVEVGLPFHQVEGICTEDGLLYRLTNEHLSYAGITVPPKLHTLDLEEFLGEYLSSH